MAPSGGPLHRIRAVRPRSRYVEAPHLVLTVDGVPLDERLEVTAPGHWFEGLIPSIHAWVDAPLRDRAQTRVVPEPGERVVAPLLVCPDCLDGDCTVVVADVIRRGDVVEWERLGIDRSDWRDVQAGRLGTRADWIPALGPSRFDATEYAAAMAAFVDDPG